MMHGATRMRGGSPSEHDDTGVGRRTDHLRVTTLRGMLQHVRGAGSGGVLVQKSSQSIDQAVDEVLEQTRESAEQTSEQDLDLRGFDGARMATFSYDATGKPFLVAVVAVGHGGTRSWRTAAQDPCVL